VRGVAAGRGAIIPHRSSFTKEPAGRLPVDPAYRDKAPYAFSGTVKKVVFDLKPAPHEEEKALHADAQRTSGAAALSG
jgi:hypothetical protein